MRNARTLRVMTLTNKRSNRKAIRYGYMDYIRVYIRIFLTNRE